MPNKRTPISIEYQNVIELLAYTIYDYCELKPFRPDIILQDQVFLTSKSMTVVNDVYYEFCQHRRETPEYEVWCERNKIKKLHDPYQSKRACMTKLNNARVLVCQFPDRFKKMIDIMRAFELIHIHIIQNIPEIIFYKINKDKVQYIKQIMLLAKI